MKLMKQKRNIFVIKIQKVLKMRNKRLQVMIIMMMITTTSTRMIMIKFFKKKKQLKSQQITKHLAVMKIKILKQNPCIHKSIN